MGIAAILLFLTLPVLLVVYVRWSVRRKLKSCARRRVAFFHPHPLAGGGGERVLWVALRAARARCADAELVVYGQFGGVAPEVVAERVQAQFGVDISDITYTAVDLTAAEVNYVRASQYPRLTLLLQSLGAVVLGALAYRRYPAHAVIETGNFTFAVLAPYLLGARTGAYVHYPIVSADMLALVRSRASAFNNSNVIARSPVLSAVKSAYYHAFAILYALVSRSIHVAAANSSWTRAHLVAIWRCSSLRVVYPPCATASQAEDSMRDPNLVISVGQFRPEKLHTVQLDAFEALAARHAGHALRLVMCGGARGPADAARAAGLKKAVAARGLPVDVRVNVPNEELTTLLARASIGLHTMRDEHFGISVVNMQAAGLVVVAHASGGVAVDIVRDGKSGFLADGGAEEFADCLWKARNAIGTAKGEEIVVEAVNDCERFSNDAFEEKFADVVSEVTAWA